MPCINGRAAFSRSVSVVRYCEKEEKRYFKRSLEGAPVPFEIDQIAEPLIYGDFSKNPYPQNNLFMSKKPGLLPKVEIFVIGIFFIGFMMWAVSKCSSTQRRYKQQAAFDAAEQARADSMERISTDIVPLDTSIQPINPEPQVEKVRVPILYVIVNGVNMRTGPGLNNRIVDRLKLYDEVEFLGEVSDSTQEIKLGENLVTNEPWVKVKTRKGQQGWVYGACVDYYKHELEGVETE